MSVGDVIALVAAVGGVLGGVGSIGGLIVTVRRGSDQESRRSAAVAVEVTQDPTVTPIERGQGGGSA